MHIQRLQILFVQSQYSTNCNVTRCYRKPALSYVAHWQHTMPLILYHIILCVCMYMYVYIYMYMHICMDMCVYIWAYMYMLMCMHICIIILFDYIFMYMLPNKSINLLVVSSVPLVVLFKPAISISGFLCPWNQH